MATTPIRNATNDTDIRETNISADSLNTKVGEVQAIPTIYTVLDRLAQIQINTSATAAGSQPCFNCTDFWQRPADTTVYIVNQLIHSAADNNCAFFTLPAAHMGRNIRILSANIINSNGTAVTKMLPILALFESDQNFGAQTFADHDLFNPPITAYTANTGTTFQPIFLEAYAMMATFYATEKDRVMKVNTIEPKIFYTLTTQNAYVPISAESYIIKISYTLA
jgi:hypothetical protein